MELTQQFVKSMFDYIDGHLYWKVVNKNRIVKSGDRAGFIRRDGYEQVKIDGKPYLSHRIIFLYHYGYLPRFLDHIDHNRNNNHVDNIRESTSSQNRMNTENRRGNKGNTKSSQYKGVSLRRDKIIKPWISYINSDGSRKHLGFFAYEQDAALAYNNAAIEMFGEYAHLNDIGRI